MRSVTALTTGGGGTGLKGDALDGLAARLRGTLLTPDADGYDGARQVWNGMIDKRPALIGRCTGTADVKRLRRFRPGQRAARVGQGRRPPHRRKERV